MTIYMFKLVCVTNRTLCSGNFLEQIEKIASLKSEKKVSAVILREKDLSDDEYLTLSSSVKKICDKYNTLFIWHSHVDMAIKQGIKNIHLPLPILRSLTDDEKSNFEIIGASCHSIDEALEAYSLGCNYITAGHVFQTDCKKDLPPRGVNFLKNICKNIDIPVLAIGGINRENLHLVKEAGAAGACIMSGFMQCKDL